MSEKLIIENESDLSMGHALMLAIPVIEEGRISETSKGKQYCFATTFKYGGNKYAVYASKNAKSDKLTITKAE